MRERFEQDIIRQFGPVYGSKKKREQTMPPRQRRLFVSIQILRRPFRIPQDDRQC